MKRIRASRRLRRGMAMAVAAALTVACDAGPEPEPASMEPLRGQIVRIGDGGRSLTLDHEAIGDRMPAMRMALPVQNAEATRDLKVGDKVRVELYESRGTSSIGAIEQLPADTPLELAEP